MFSHKTAIQWPLMAGFLFPWNHSAAQSMEINSPTKMSALPQVRLRPSTQKISIQELEDGETYSGAGTGFQLATAQPNSSKVIFGYADPREPSKMRINNQLVVLKYLGKKVLKTGKGRQRLGERVQESWGNETITAVFDFTTTVVGEEGVGYKGQVTIRMNGQKASFPITGGSGC